MFNGGWLWLSGGLPGDGVGPEIIKLPSRIKRLTSIRYRVATFESFWRAGYETALPEGAALVKISSPSDVEAPWDALPCHLPELHLACKN